MAYDPGIPIREANSLPVHSVDTAGNAIGGTAATAPFAKLTNNANIGAGNATYRATGTGYAAYATPTDMLTISGSASKTVIITALNIAPSATAATVGTFYWIKRSAANTGGTAAAQTAVPFDSADAPASAVVNLYSVIPSGLGAAVGNVGIAVASINAATGVPAAYGYIGSTANGVPASPTMVIDLRKPITLRAGEFLALNYNGAALPAGFTSTWSVEWAEVPVA